MSPRRVSALVLCWVLGAGLGLGSVPGLAAEPDPLAALQSLSAPEGSGAGAMEGLREDAARLEALRVGVAGGYRFRARAINRLLESRAGELDRIWVFAPLLVEGRLLPPVIGAVDESVALDAAGGVLRESARAYRVVASSRLVTRPPTWRDYLRVPEREVPGADPVLLPRDGDERARWARAVARGWKEGVRQAELEFAGAAARLERDYLGVLRARELMARGVLVAPHLDVARRAVVADGEGLRIDDAVWRVTRPEAFEAEASRWRVLVEAPGW